jgi:hypothetical protein
MSSCRIDLLSCVDSVSLIKVKFTGWFAAPTVFQTPVLAVKDLLPSIFLIFCSFDSPSLFFFSFRRHRYSTINDSPSIHRPETRNTSWLSFSAFFPPLTYIASTNIFHHNSSFSLQIQQDGDRYRLSGIGLDGRVVRLGIGRKKLRKNGETLTFPS